MTCLDWLKGVNILPYIKLLWRASNVFVSGIRYLMGWAMAAADGAKKQLAEWPPHPDRVFMALAAAWFETGREEPEGKPGVG